MVLSRNFLPIPDFKNLSRCKASCLVLNSSVYINSNGPFCLVQSSVPELCSFKRVRGSLPV